MAEGRERNRAHLTISRAGASVDASHVAHALAISRGPEWTVNAVELIESRLGEGGQGYPARAVLASFPLGFPRHLEAPGQPGQPGEPERTGTCPHRTPPPNTSGSSRSFCPSTEIRHDHPHRAPARRRAAAAGGLVLATLLTATACSSNAQEPLAVGIPDAWPAAIDDGKERYPELGSMGMDDARWRSEERRVGKECPV